MAQKESQGTEATLQQQIDEHRLKMLQKFMGLDEAESRRLVDILTSPTPREWQKPRPIRGGRTIKYVSGQHFIQRFNEAFGLLWSYEVPDRFEENGHIVAKGRLTIKIPGRTITREYPDGVRETIRFEGFEIAKEQYGSSEVKRWSSDEPMRDGRGQPQKDSKGNIMYKHRAGDPLELGNDYKAAATDAMKKCGTQLGIFLDVYGPQDEEEEEKPSDAQINAVYVRAEKLGWSDEQTDKWVEEKLGKPIDKAPRKEVLGLTAELIEMAKKQAA